MRITYSIPLIIFMFGCSVSTQENKIEPPVSEVVERAFQLTSQAQTNEELRAALATLDSVLVRDSSHQAAYNAKLSVLRKLGDTEAIYASMKAMAQNNPDLSSLQLALGLEHEVHGNQPEALEAYAKASALLNATLDTIPAEKALAVNSNAINLALSITLEGKNPLDNSHLKALAEDPRNYGLKNMMETIRVMERNQLVSMARMSSDQKQPENEAN